MAGLTSDTPVSSPFITTFKVEEVLPFHAKKHVAWLKQMNKGLVTPVKRGSDVDTDQVVKSWKLTGSEHRTVFFTRAEGKSVAVVAERERYRVGQSPAFAGRRPTEPGKWRLLFRWVVARRLARPSLLELPSLNGGLAFSLSPPGRGRPGPAGPGEERPETLFQSTRGLSPSAPHPARKVRHPLPDGGEGKTAHRFSVDGIADRSAVTSLRPASRLVFGSSWLGKSNSPRRGPCCRRL